MHQSLLAPLLVALVALSTRAEDAPRIRETNPVTGESAIRSMVPLEQLPKVDAKVVARMSDSIYAALGGELRVADTIRMPPDLPGGIVRGKTLKGAVLQRDGKVAVAVEDSTWERDLTGEVAWALWYARNWGDSKIQFSLDPVDVNDFSKGNTAWYSPPDGLKPFSIGRDLYEADMDLKLYALGYERDGASKVRDIASPPPGYRSRIQITADLFAKGIERQGGLKARLWIVCDSVFALVTDFGERSLVSTRLAPTSTPPVSSMVRRSFPPGRSRRKVSRRTRAGPWTTVLSTSGSRRSDHISGTSIPREWSHRAMERAFALSTTAASSGCEAASWK